jgi:hypothetical protein
VSLASTAGFCKNKDISSIAARFPSRARYRCNRKQLVREDSAMAYSAEDFTGMKRIPEDFDYEPIDLKFDEAEITIGSSGLITFNGFAVSLYLHGFQTVALFPHKHDSCVIALRLLQQEDAETYPIKGKSNRKSKSVSCKDFLEKHGLLPPKTGKKSIYKTRVREFIRGSGFLVLEVLLPER